MSLDEFAFRHAFVGDILPIPDQFNLPPGWYELGSEEMSRPLSAEDWPEFTEAMGVKLATFILPITHVDDGRRYAIKLTSEPDLEN